MDQQKPKASGIPRFSASSRLPQPSNFSASTTSGAMPQSNFKTLRSAASTENFGSNGSKSTSQYHSVRGAYSFATLRGKPPQAPQTKSQESTQSTARSTLTRRPLGPSTRSITGQRGAIPQYGESDAGTSNQKSLRQAYTQENQEQGIDTANTEAAITSPSVSPPLLPESDSSHLDLPKTGTPSLSDRTIQSLHNVPPMSTPHRRRSSFFSPQSPMTPQARPISVSATPSVSKLNYGSVRGKNNTYARPSSPSKNPPAATHVKASAGRRTSSALPYNLQSKASTSTTTKRPPSPKKPSTRAASATANVTGASNTQKKPMAKPSVPSNGLNQAQKAPEKRPPSTQADSKGPKDSPNSSSAALRQQIAKAKAAHRATAEKPKTLNKSSFSSGYNFEETDDPFNTKPKDDKFILRNRIDKARADGRLNIAALNLKSVPDEVLQMYESEAMAESSVPWDETVDLARFIAADNDIAEIGEDVFSDQPLDLFSTDPDAKGNQFGGLELLDLHGNKISRMPPGLARLELLTTLNLSRNNLDNTIFDVVTRMPSLRDLSLAQNKLTKKMPESINALNNLETLDLSRNTLTALPSLHDLTHLRVLTVSSNRLTTLPMDTLATLPRLSHLTASSNALTGIFITGTITTLALHTLDISQNSIAALSISPLHLPNVTRLDVSNNRLTTFPNISTWTCLMSLLAEGNQLTDFPPGMTELREKLKTVNLERNAIREVDEGIVEMEALERLLLMGCPLRERRLLGMQTVDVKREFGRKRELAMKLGGGAKGKEKDEGWVVV